MAKTTPPSGLLEKFVVRLSDGLRDRIAAAAKENERSMNSEINYRLQASFENSSCMTILRRIEKRLKAIEKGLDKQDD